MDISAPVTAVTVLPSQRGRRWLPTRRRAESPPAPDEVSTEAAPAVTEVPAEVTTVIAVPATATVSTTAGQEPPLASPEHAELAPLAAFGRWMADFDAPAAAPAQRRAPVVAPAAPPAVAVAATPAVTVTPAVAAPPAAPAASAAPSPGPSTTAPAAPAASTLVPDSGELARLKADLAALTEELETARQRSAAERMHLLEELANARDARRAAETELAAVQAVLDAAERRLPAPRRGTLHAVS